MSSRDLKARAAKLRRSGKLEAALELYRRLPGDDLHGLLLTAELALELNQRQEAIGCYRRLAERYAQDGFILRAITISKKILELAPDDQETKGLVRELESEPRASSPPGPIEERTPRASEVLSDLILSWPAPPADEEGPQLPRIPIFSDLPRAALVDVLEEMRMTDLQPGQRVIEQGDVGRSFFVVAGGRLRVEKELESGESVFLAHLHEGAFFGEMALIDHRGTRSASVIAEEDARVLEFDRELIDGVVARYPSVGRVLHDYYSDRLLQTTLAVHPLFAPFTLSEHRVLMTEFQRRQFSAGETLVAQDTAGEGLYLLLSGTLEVQRRDGATETLLAHLRPGDVFGEISLLKGTPTTATVVATEEAIVLRLGREAFERVVQTRREIAELLERISEERIGQNREGMAVAAGRQGSPLI